MRSLVTICDVGVAHRPQRLLAAQVAGGVAEELERLLHAALDGRDEELLLRPEEPEEVRLRDAGRRGDVLGRRAVEAAARERGLRRGEHRLAPLGRRLAWSSRPCCE